MSIDDIERTYQKYLIISDILTIANKLASNDKNKYEIRNCIERWLLTLANRDHINILTKKEIGYTLLIQELSSKTRNSLKDTANIVNEIRTKVHKFSIDYTIQGDISKLIIGKDFVKYRDYIRKIDPERISLLLRVSGNNEIALGLMVMTYACIIPGPQHWNASKEHYKIYYDHGIRVEGFASPINAQLLSIDETTKYCSLFPNVDKPFGSIGNFFDINFGESGYNKVAVGPPYTEELLVRIADKLIKECENKYPVRFYFTHSLWSDAPGYIKMKNSKYCIYSEITEKGKHYYVNTNVVPNERIIAQFNTVLLVLSNYQDDEDFTQLLNGLKLSI